MCKIMMITGDLSRRQVELLLQYGNAAFQTENDGFGFLAAGEGGLAMGRYETPCLFPGFKKGMPEDLISPCVEVGEIPEVTHTLLIHGRTSTNIRGLRGCHPFEYQNKYLIHNGIVHYCRPGPDPIGLVDSEQFLHWLVDHECNWDEAISDWSGWGAIGVYDSESQKLTAAVDGASLSLARRSDGQGWIMATCDKHLLEASSFSEVPTDTIPISLRARILTFSGKEMISERHWVGFKSYGSYTVNDHRAGRKKGRKGGVIITHGQYKLENGVSQNNSFPGYVCEQ